MGSVAFSLSETFESCGPCAKCGVTVVMPQNLVTKKREDHSSFFCPNGHSLIFPGKSELEKTQELLATERRWREQANAQRDRAIERANTEARKAAAARGVVTRIRNRVGNGVCPCCNRTFQNLLRHMQGKHPEYKQESEA